MAQPDITSIQIDTGTNIDDIVKLEGIGSPPVASLPAVDGSQLTAVLHNTVEDTIPQLGGDLDVNGFNIISVNNGGSPLIPGDINIISATGSGNEYGGEINLTGGIATGPYTDGGDINLTGGSNTHTTYGYGGVVNLTGGAGPYGGNVTLTGGAPTKTSGIAYAGSVRLEGGPPSVANGGGGPILIFSGIGQGTGPGGRVQIAAGSAQSGVPGDVTIAGGRAFAGTADGGSITLQPGDQIGGVDGTVTILAPDGVGDAIFRIRDNVSLTVGNSIGFKVANGTLTTSVDYQLPELPVGSPFPTQFLTTNASGVLSWADVGSTLTLNDLSDVNVGTPGAGEDGYVVQWDDTGSEFILAPAPYVPLTINAQAGTAYTLVLTDAGKYVRMTNGAANTVTIPPNSSVAFDIGTEVIVRQSGAGTTTIAEGSGVTINTIGGSPPSLSLSEQHTSLSLIKVATNEWDLAGSIA
jgi:hypothetical protein